jgi:multidrug efflux system membrane fusion protein
MKLRLLMACMALAALLAGCPGAGNAGAGKGKGGVFYSVEVETIVPRRIDYKVNASGSVEAFEVVQVTARVAGSVERVLFREGQEVESEQVLVEIEPARFKLMVDAADAAASRAKSQYEDADAGLKRRQEAVAKSPTVLTPEELETWKTRTAVAKAMWDEEKVKVEQARLNQQYASPRSPVKGIIQTRTVQTGQYVQPGTVIATLIRRDPLLLRFDVPGREAAALNPGLDATFTVTAVSKELRAKIIHVAASARGESRLVAVTAEVNAEDAALVRPGSFASVSVTVDAREDAAAIPETSVRPSAEGFLAFVVEGEGENAAAVQRVLQLGLRTADGRVEVRSGVKPGEVLVVRGGEALRDGAKVSVKGGEAAP